MNDAIALQEEIDRNMIRSAEEFKLHRQDATPLRTFQRRCRELGLRFHTRHLSSEEVLHVVGDAVTELGSVYGRKTVTGYLTSRGLNVGEGRVAQALSVLDPQSHERRVMGVSRQLNPLAYHAPYFGYNVHVDQNEKLVDFGVVICAAVDGASNFVLGFAVMEHKNCLEIYENLYRPIVQEFGLFDCLISDCGNEFALAQFVQQLVSGQTINSEGVLSSRPAIKRLRSTENNRIERLWVMVNDRCVYPLKNILVHLQEAGSIDLINPFVRNAVSFISRGIINILLGRLRDSWNHHSIPNQGRPVDIATNNYCYPVNIPDLQEAANLFEQSGGRLTRPWEFGEDPVPQARRSARDSFFMDALPFGFDGLANSVLADDDAAVLQALQFYAEICFYPEFL